MTNTFAPPARSWHEVLQLLGGSGLGDYLDFVQRFTDPATHPGELALVEQWRAARAHRQALQVSQAELASANDVRTMPAELQAALKALLARPEVQAQYSTVPVAPAMVQIDRLLIYQNEIDLDKSDAIVARLGSAPNPMDCFKLAFGRDDTGPSDDWTLARERDDSWEFSSSAHDFRYLGAQLIDPANVSALATAHPGAVAAVALVLGHSANHINAVRHGKRLVLHNGYHRVHALRRLGLSHVPCMVEVLADLDEALQLGAEVLVEQAELFFASARPPLFMDYFNPALTRLHRARLLRRQVRLTLRHDSLRLMQP